MADHDLRALERLVAAGDGAAVERLVVALTRLGQGWNHLPLPDGLRLGRRPGLYLWEPEHSSVSIEMVYVPEGDFIMGSDTARWRREKPEHVHPQPYGFWIARTGTTYRQYDQFRGANKGVRPEVNYADPPPRGQPMSDLTWKEANAYCRWLGLRLPTEAEWEKAARGTDGRSYPWGEELPDGDRCAYSPDQWEEEEPYENTPEYWARRHARLVSVDNEGEPLRPAGVSPYGAVDMVGNSQDWCLDWYEDDAYARYSRGNFSRPKARTRCAYGKALPTPHRVLRGGGGNSASNTRVTYRRSGDPAEYERGGVRPVLSLDATAPD